MHRSRSLSAITIAWLVFVLGGATTLAAFQESTGRFSALSSEGASLASTSGFDCGTAVRVMPLGDSITKGSGTSPFTGYRKPLYYTLEAEDYFVDFVGAFSDGGEVVPLFDSQHQGISGIRDDDIASTVFASLTANPAAVVLLHIGTNDLRQNPIDDGMEDIALILDEIDRFDPAIIVVLAQIVNRNVYDPNTTQFNQDMAAMAAARIQAGDQIVLVNMEPALNYSTDMADYLHPNSLGYDKMAAVWYAALEGILPDCSPVAPTAASSLENGEDVRLSWTHTAPNSSYEVWRSGTPYFAAGDPGATLVNTVTPSTEGELLSVLDTAAPAGQPAYYLIKAINAFGSSSAAAGGRFLFAVTPGN